MFFVALFTRGMVMNCIIFDIDGTICPIKKERQEYNGLVSCEKIILKMKKLKEAGFKIALFTSRNMCSFGNSLDIIFIFIQQCLMVKKEKNFT